MARPASYATIGATSNNWVSGAYAYDGAGNVTAVGGSSFTYDAVSRLTASTVRTLPAVSGGATASQSVTYDAVGNITSMGTNAPPVTLTTSAATNRLASSAYDSMGSMTSWNGNAYTYDAFGMAWKVVASGNTYHHLYTADDERIWTFQQSVPSRWTLRDLDGTVLREFKNNAGTWSVERDYVHRDGTLLAAWTPTETIHFHPDHLGTPRLATGAGGAYRSYHAYHPYGTEATAFNQDAERMKFTGHERDLGITTSTADDLDYMHARFYNMQVGRFTSVDPARLSKFTSPQAWNRYNYVLGNPLRYIDPTGLAPVIVKDEKGVHFAADDNDDGIADSNQILTVAGIAISLGSAEATISFKGTPDTFTTPVSVSDPTNSSQPVTGTTYYVAWWEKDKTSSLYVNTRVGWSDDNSNPFGPFKFLK